MLSFSALMALGSAVVIILIGFRVYFLDRGKYQYRAFGVLCCLLSWTCFCWFEIEQTRDLATAIAWRQLQGVRVFCFPFMTYCCWRFVTIYMRTIAFWFKVVFLSLLLLPAFIFLGLDFFAGLGHGKLIVLENGNWGLIFSKQNGFTLVRSIWILVNYLLSFYFLYVVWRKETIQVRKSRLFYLQILFLLTIGISVFQNYFTRVGGVVLPINESWSALILVLFFGWAISDFQLFDLKPESAFEQVAGSMTNLLIITNTSFQIKSINPTALSFFAKNQLEARNGNLEGVVGHQAATQLTSQLRHGAKQEITFQQDHKNARILFSTSLIRNRRGGLIGYVFIGNDLTDYYQALDDVQRYNAELEASNESLERFAFIVSHDLKEPLRTINGFVTLLDRKLANEKDEATKEYIGYINQGIVRMNALIDSILMISRLENEQEADDCVNLERVVLEVGDKLRALRVQKNASIQYAENLPVIKGKYYQVSLLFQNLIENGIKYNKNTTPLVRVDCQAIAEGYEFAISDNGIGIDPKYHQQVFKMFKRLHSWSDYEGTGIGLTMCQKIVENLGGRIWIETPENGNTGTVFKFVLPTQN